MDALTTCPACGLRAGRGGIEPDRPVNASPECWAINAELTGFELGNPSLAERFHQLTVDAYGAQHAAPGSELRTAYSLVGLYLAIERGWTGIRVRNFHRRMGRPDATWPTFVRPAAPAWLTVADVVAVGARLRSVNGHAEAIERWARSVWDAYGGEHAAVRALATRLLRDRFGSLE